MEQPDGLTGNVHNRLMPVGTQIKSDSLAPGERARQELQRKAEVRD